MVCRETMGTQEHHWNGGPDLQSHWKQKKQKNAIQNVTLNYTGIWLRKNIISL